MLSRLNLVSYLPDRYHEATRGSLTVLLSPNILYTPRTSLSPSPNHPTMFTPPDPPNPRAATVLDLLPENVCARIATFTSSGRQTESALNLAEVSEIQREAVLYSLRHAFTVENASSPRWSDLFHSSVRDLSIEGPDAAVPSILHTLLRAPSLRIACIPGTLPFLSALAEQGSVRELTVLLVEQDHEPVLDALSKLRLERLNMCCFPYQYPEACVGGLFQSFGADALAKSCPALKKLDVRCYCRRSFPMVKVLESFSELKEVTLSTELSDDALPVLRRLESVKLNGTVFDAATFATRIGTAVTHVEANDAHTLSNESVLQLKECYRIEYLGLKVSPETEQSVASLVASLPRLRALYMQRQLDDYRYRQVEEGFILDIVRSAPQLEELGVAAVKISLEELKNVLQHLGSRLRKLSISVSDQDEPAHARLVSLFQLIATYNRSVENLAVDDILTMDSLRTVTPALAWVGLDGRQEALAIKTQLYSAKKILLRHVPLLHEGDLDRFIRRVLF